MASQSAASRLAGRQDDDDLDYELGLGTASQVSVAQGDGTKQSGSKSSTSASSSAARSNLEDMLEDEDFGINTGGTAGRSTDPARGHVSKSDDDVLDDLLRAAGRDDAVASSAMRGGTESSDGSSLGRLGDGSSAAEDSVSLDGSMSMGFSTDMDTSGLEGDDDMLGVSPAMAICEPDPRVEVLERAIEREKSCPEVLPYEDELIESLGNKLDREEAFLSSSASRHLDPLLRELREHDSHRGRYQLATYARVRLCKLRGQLFYLASHEDVCEARLSGAEHRFVKDAYLALSKHLRGSVLQHLRGRLSQVKDPRLARGPRVDRYVTVRCEESVGPVPLDPAGGSGPGSAESGMPRVLSSQQDEEEKDASFDEGTVYIVRYDKVRSLIHSGKL